MDDLFKWDDKYAMFEYDVWTVSWSNFGYESTNKKIIKLEAQSPRTISPDKGDESKTDGSNNV